MYYKVYICVLIFIIYFRCHLLTNIRVGKSPTLFLGVGINIMVENVPYTRVLCDAMV